MTAAACGACGAPTGDHAALCQDCTHDLQLALIAAAILGPQLDLARSRQARMTDHHGSASYSHPLPYDPRSAAAADHLAMVLSGLIRALNLPQSAA